MVLTSTTENLYELMTEANKNMPFQFFSGSSCTLDHDTNTFKKPHIIRRENKTMGSIVSSLDSSLFVSCCQQIMWKKKLFGFNHGQMKLITSVKEVIQLVLVCLLGG